MSNYEQELREEVERVTLRGSPDKKTVQKLASIIWRLEQRVAELESEVVVDEKPPVPAPAVEEKQPTKRTNSRKVSNKTETK